MPYLDRDAFAARTDLPPEYLDAIEDRTPGWLDVQLEQWSRWIDARLTKRYEVPFASPAPEIVKLWLSTIVTFRALVKRGVDPSDLDVDLLRQDYERVVGTADRPGEIKEAADAEKGLFELPLRQDVTTSGVSKGGPSTYAEATPYGWRDEQARLGREEDRSRRGGSFHG